MTSFIFGERFKCRFGTIFGHVIIAFYGKIRLIFGVNHISEWPVMRYFRSADIGFSVIFVQQDILNNLGLPKSIFVKT